MLENKYRLEVSDDNLNAFFVYAPDSENTDTKELDENYVKSFLKGNGIKYGINEKLIKEMVGNIEANHRYELVVGKKMIMPKVGHIKYNFEKPGDLAPELDENGNVNYHKLGVISKVEKGQILATLIPNVDGEDGIDVYGKIIKAPKPKPLRIAYGKNTLISKDKLELRAKSSGLVKFLDNKVIVNNVYEVPNNVGTSTGDIEFDGSVVIDGSVLAGYSVKATGDIEVNGVVESAELEAGGNIVLHSGIQGMGTGKVIANGDIKCRFIEQAIVNCARDIKSEAILHSDVSAKGSIVVEGKKAMISGGNVRAGVSVTAKTLGSNMGTATTIIVGINPTVYIEYYALADKIKSLSEEQDKLEKAITLLNRFKETQGKLDKDKQSMYTKFIRSKIIVSKNLSESQIKYQELKKEVESKVAGTVYVRGSIYPGVKIEISESYYFVKEEIMYSKFKKEGVDIKILPL